MEVPRFRSMKLTGKTSLFFLTTPPLLKLIPQKTVFWGIVLQKTKGETHGAVDCFLWKRSRDTP